MKEYVVILPIVSGTKKILLVTKAKPSWQKGKLNLLGGSVEPGELPHIAAIRELKEESGIEALAVTKCGEIVGRPGDEFIVHCYTCEMDRYASLFISPGPTEVEQLLRMRVKDWTIYNHSNGDKQLTVSFGDA